MKKIKPKPLQIGDTIGLLSVSGVLNDDNMARICNAGNYFVAAGFNIIMSNTMYKSCDYLAGTDEDRVVALEKLFANPEVSTIVAARGGYGILRILDKINFDIIRDNPKNFVGYSDITALLLMIYKKTGLITYHGAMACFDFGDEINEFTRDAFYDALQENLHETNLSPDALTINSCDVEGTLWGGNLATIVSMLGLDFVPNEDLILFLEDINEPVYKIDRMMTQLFNFPEFKKNVKAIVLGDFTNLDNKDWFEKFWLGFSKCHGLPVYFGLKVGHETEKLTLPVGAKVNLKTENNQTRIIFDI